MGYFVNEIFLNQILLFYFNFRQFVGFRFGKEANFQNSESLVIVKLFYL